MTKIGPASSILLNTKRFGRQTDTRLNGNSKVKSTADDELAPAAGLELLGYIFREVFYPPLSLSHVAAVVSVSCSDHCVSAKSSLYLRHVLKVLCFKE